jgi:hypothetical protein
MNFWKKLSSNTPDQAEIGFPISAFLKITKP